MSESHSSEWVDEGQPVNSSEPLLDRNHTSEASDGFMDVESSEVGVETGVNNQVKME